MTFSESLAPSMTLLPQLLRSRDAVRYQTLIERAEAGYYHDFKFDLLPGADYVCPKIQLAAELSVFPELGDLVKDVYDGVFDDQLDEADKDRMREEIEPEFGAFRDLLGL